MRILVAEDDAISRRVLEKVLTEWGHDVTSTSTGLEAWTEFRKAPFALVLSELDGHVAALPLAEVVSVREAEEDVTIAGTRFCAVRLKERVILADYARSVSQTAT